MKLKIREKNQIKILVIDTEFTVGNWKKGQGGDPFDPRNKLCLVGCLSMGGGTAKAYKIEYDDEPFGESLAELQSLINEHDLLVLFNAKRDLHWLRRYGIKFQDKRIWDVQLVHFIITGQENPYPSLNGVADYYNLGQKDDVIQTEYWDKGIDTNEIPLEKLVPYLHQDLTLTGNCYEKQQVDLKDNPAMHRLVVLDNIDLLILEEMEWNGILYDLEESQRKAEQVRDEILALDNALTTLVGDYPINWSSDDHRSCILYGGSITSKSRVVDGLYKTGKKAGQPKHRVVLQEYRFDRLINPLNRTELNKDGYWSTAEPILRQLKAYGKAKDIIAILLGRSKLEKVVSSYFDGIPKICGSMGWGNTIHGTLNQCVAATGRLSSSKPNLQNNPKEINLLFRSRFE